MKRLIQVTVVFVLLLSMVLTSCTKKTAETETVKAATPTSEAAATTEATQETTAPAEVSTLPTGHVADTLKIGFVDVTGTGIISDLLGVARDKGFVEEELSAIGVKAEFIPMTGAGPAINEALASGSLDVGFLGDVPAIIGKAAGIDTQIISFNGLIIGASVVVQKDSKYQTIEDLKGKKIATQKGAFMHKSLVDILTANKLTVADIEFVNLNAQGAAEALVSGSVDATVVGGSTLTKLLEDGYGRVVVDFREHPEWNAGGFGLARTKYITENPDIIKALLRALVKAQQLAIEDKEVLLNQWVGVGLSKSSYEYLYPKYDNYYAIKKSEEIVSSGKAVQQFLLDNDLVTESFDFDAWINSSFYEEAYKELEK